MLRPTWLSLLLLAGVPLPAAAQEDPVEWSAHIEGLKRRFRLEPSNPNHYLRVAQACSAAGDTRQVLEFARAAEGRGAHPARVYLLIGDHYLRLHHFERALRNFDIALRTAPGSAYGWTRIWRALLEMQRAGQRSAVDVRGMAADLESRGYYFPRAWREPRPPPVDPAAAKRLAGVGYRLLGSRDLAGAVRAFLRALDADPTCADAFRGLAITHARQQRIDLAFGAYALFLELAPPNHPDVPKIRRILQDFYRSRSRGG